MNNRFAKGTGVYQCRCCRRNTRQTDIDSANLNMCGECYESAGIENQILDEGDPDGSLQREVDALNARCRAKGGTPR